MKIIRNIVQLGRPESGYGWGYLCIYPAVLSKRYDKYVWMLLSNHKYWHFTQPNSFHSILNFFKENPYPIIKRTFACEVHNGILDFGFQDSDIMDNYTVGEFIEAAVASRIALPVASELSHGSHEEYEDNRLVEVDLSH